MSVKNRILEIRHPTAGIRVDLRAAFLVMPFLLALFAFGQVPSDSERPGGGDQVSQNKGEADRLAALGLSATSGAAPGYVEDRACQTCYAEIYKSYQEVGMAKSFLKPSPDNVVEDFSRSRGYHEASQRHYQMVHEDGKYKFRRYQVGQDGKEINVFEQEVD